MNAIRLKLNKCQKMFKVGRINNWKFQIKEIKK